MDICWSTEYGTYTSQKYTIDCFTDVKPIYSYRHGFIIIIILFTTGYNATPGLL